VPTGILGKQAFLDYDESSGRKLWIKAGLIHLFEMGPKRALTRSKTSRVFGHPSKQPRGKLRVGLYARVSTHDQQTIPLQARAMREYATRRGWRIALQVKEIGSGASQRESREKRLEAARRRDLDVVLVWRLDRWGR
jgi:predicted site-specific integrase-resolvase